MLLESHGGEATEGFLSMAIKAPRAGESMPLLDPKRGRSMCDRVFFYPDGRKETFTLYQYTGPVSSIIFPLTSNNEVVAVRQFRHGINGVLLELPGGSPEGSQSVEDAATAELLQETGYQAEKVVMLGAAVWFEPALINTRFMPVLGLGCRKVKESEPEKNEVLETVVVPLEEWYRKIWNGEVIDAKSIALSFLAMPLTGIKPAR